MRPNDFECHGLKTWIGRIDHLERESVIGTLSEFDCRNNRLAQMGLRQDGFEEAVATARRTYGAAWIAVLIGTTTSGILETELAYRRRSPGGALPEGLRYQSTHNLFSVADFVRRYLGLEGPAAAISTACSSSAKVFAVDSLCLTTLYGFASLGLVSDGPCRPCDSERNGLSIDEAAGFALLERREARQKEIVLLGYGESSDAYHMSTPHSHGEGAALAMQRAGSCRPVPADIDYINLHGTGSPTNDSAEDQAMCRVFGERTPCSSTKGWTGHTLGAAGITEAIITAISMRADFIPGTLNCRVLDPKLRSRILLRSESRGLRRAMSNSFGFGGNNCSLLFGES